MRTTVKDQCFAVLLACAFFGFTPRAAADGAVYAMTNALTSDGGNSVVVWARAADGTLTPKQTIATGGGGSGVQLDGTDSLGSQGSLALDQAHKHLFAVNTESSAENTQDCNTGSISSFLVAQDGTLTLVGGSTVPSGGFFPDSLAVHGNVLYVLNAGGPGVSCLNAQMPNITGFKVSPDGTLSLIPGSTQTIDPGPLNGTGSGVNCPVSGFPTPGVDCGRNPPAFPRSPGQVGFTPDGSQLIVTVKGTNTIYVFPVNKNGTTGTPAITQAPGPALPTYFGFDFDKTGHLILSEAFGAATSIPMGGAGAVSSFAIGKRGGLTAISSDAGDGETAACWVVVDPSSRYAYISNNISGTISSYSIGGDGSLTLLAAAAANVIHPNDVAVVHDKRNAFLYVNDCGAGQVDAYSINSDGSLTSIGAGTGLTPEMGAQGLAAY